MRYIVTGGLQLPPPADRVGVIATAAIEQTGRYYKQKDDSANPFKPNPQELSKYVAEFKQEPVPSHLSHDCPPDASQVA